MDLLYLLFIIKYNSASLRVQKLVLLVAKTDTIRPFNHITISKWNWLSQQKYGQKFNLHKCAKMLELWPPLCKFHCYLSNNQLLDFGEKCLVVLILFVLQILGDGHFLEYWHMLHKPYSGYTFQSKNFSCTCKSPTADPPADICAQNFKRYRAHLDNSFIP